MIQGNNQSISKVNSSYDELKLKSELAEHRKQSQKTTTTTTN